MSAPRPRTLREQLDAGDAVRVAGHLAAFPVDVPADPFSIASVPAGAVQGALFDPEVCD